MADEARGSGDTLASRILASLPAMTRFVRRRMGSDMAARESASDIVQSTCRELLRSASNYEDRGEASFQRWIQSAAEHKLQNRARHWRAGQRADGGRTMDADEAELLGPEMVQPSRDAMLREDVERLARAVAALSLEYRAVLQRSQIDGASYAEIAVELGKSPAAVRKLVARAMTALSAELDPDDE